MDPFLALLGLGAMANQRQAMIDAKQQLTLAFHSTSYADQRGYLIAALEILCRALGEESPLAHYYDDDYG